MDESCKVDCESKYLPSVAKSSSLALYFHSSAKNEMKQSARLAWNFELMDSKPFDFAGLALHEADVVRWESRFFWADKTPIGLYHLPAYFLDLSRCQIKKREDTYFLLDGYDYNIKKRRDELVYKPLVESKKQYFGFGKKIDLSNLMPGEMLLGTPPISAHELMTLVESARQITVTKTALIYKLPTQPTIKLELARLLVGTSCYFSVCLEGRSYELISELSSLLIQSAEACDYVNFLKKTILP